MNCLTYLLTLIEREVDLKLFYDGNHVVGFGLVEVFDFNNIWLDGSNKHKYLPIEECHDSKTLKKIFNLNEDYSKILDEYFAELK
jgi:hypothetical protein